MNGLTDYITHRPWTETISAWYVQVDEAYQRALDQGLTVTRPPADEEWGVRECHIRHPDGHTFRVGAGIHDE